jgi:hypothetical protein
MDDSSGNSFQFSVFQFSVSSASERLRRACSFQIIATSSAIHFRGTSISVGFYREPAPDQRAALNYFHSRFFLQTLTVPPVHTSPRYILRLQTQINTSLCREIYYRGGSHVSQTRRITIIVWIFSGRALQRARIPQSVKRLCANERCE